MLSFTIYYFASLILIAGGMFGLGHYSGLLRGLREAERMIEEADDAD